MQPPTPELHEPAEPPPADFRPMTLVLRPSGLNILVNRPNLLVGRHSSADLRLPLPDVSRRHCRVLFAEGRWRVLDLQSLNGVVVNGERLEQTDLRHGDELRVGGFAFLVDLEARPSEADAALDSGGRVLRSIMEALPAPQRMAG